MSKLNNMFGNSGDFQPTQVDASMISSFRANEESQVIHGLIPGKAMLAMVQRSTGYILQQGLGHGMCNVDGFSEQYVM